MSELPGWPGEEPELAGGPGGDGGLLAAQVRKLFAWAALPQAVTEPDSGRFVMVNAAYCAALGYSEAELLARDKRAVTEPADWPARQAAVASLAVAGPPELRLVEHMVRGDGSRLRVGVRLRALRDETGRLRYVHGAVELLRATPYPTRRTRSTPPAPPPVWAGTRGRLTQLLTVRPGAGVGLQVAIIQLRALPALVGTLGFTAAEQVHALIGQRLVALDAVHVRLVEPLGPSFLLVAARAGREVNLAAALRVALHEPVEFAGLMLPLHPQIGVTEVRAGERDADAAMRRAWLARDAAGRSGELDAQHSEALDRQAVADLALVGELMPALARGEVSLHYQLKYQLPARRPIGAEALLRWTHPERGPLPPEQVVALAEQAGLIPGLTCWVIDQACAQAARWRAQGSALPVAVNVPPALLGSPVLLAHLAQATARHQLPVSSLELEITETALATGERIQRGVEHLHRLGYPLHIDDFGTGYSSLAHLKMLPPTTIKIDRAFISRLDRDRRDQELVRAVITMASALGHQVLAEGVETNATIRLLTALGCTQAQGFLLHRPTPAHQIRLPHHA